MPAILVAYWLLPRGWRNGLVAVVSLIFYTWGAGPYVFLLLSAIVVNYAAGIAIDSDRLADQARARRAVLLTAVIWDLGILAIWKYAGFASRQIDELSSALGLGDTHIVALALPIGISFFTFHHISLRGRRLPAQPAGAAEPAPVRHLHRDVPAADRRSDRALPRDRRPARRDRAHDRLDDFAAGFPRFALGLAKKVVIADTIAPVANAAFATAGGDLTTHDRLDRRARLHRPDLLRLLRLLRHGDRPRPDVRLPVAGELRPAVLGGVDHRLLAPLAHVAVALVPRLRLHPARRQPRRARPRRTATC